MNKRNNRFLEFLADKGFYIVLFVCVAAIGISGYALFFASPKEPEPLTEQPISWLPSPNPSTTKQPVITLPPKDEKVPTIVDEPSVPIFNPEDDIPVIGTSPTPRDVTIPSPAGIVATPGSAPSPTPKAAKTAKFFWPLKGDVIKPFSIDLPVYNETLDKYRTHAGVDIEAPLGTHVMAAADGVVVTIDSDYNSGTYVIIDHGDGLKSRYSNLQKNTTVILDQNVKAGDIIGGVGETSAIEKAGQSHLHFEITKNDKQVSPVDYLPEELIG